MAEFFKSLPQSTNVPVEKEPVPTAAPWEPLPVSGRLTKLNADAAEIAKNILAKTYVGKDKLSSEDYALAVEEAQKRTGTETPRLPVIDPGKPWGWAEQRENGDLLYVTPDGDRRWVKPSEVQIAVQQGMQPVSTADELRQDRAKELANSPVTAALTEAIDTLSFGGARWLQRNVGASYKDVLMGKAPEGQRIAYTPEEQQLQQEENPLATAVGAIGGVGAGLLIPAGPFAQAGKLGAKIASGIAQSKNVIKAGQILTEGAAIGLSGGMSEIGMMSDKEYDKMGPGDIIEKLVKSAAVGAAVNGVLSVGASVIGKTAKWGYGKIKPSEILKKAGTTEREIVRIKDEADKAFKEYEHIAGSFEKDINLKDVWSNVKNGVDDGTYSQIRKKGYDHITDVRRSKDLEKIIEDLDEIPLTPAIKDIVISKKNAAVKELSEVKKRLLLQDDITNLELNTWFNKSPAEICSNWKLAQTALLKTKKKIVSAIPFGDIFGRATVGGLFGSGISYSSGGNPYGGGLFGVLAGAALPSLLSKGIMITAGKTFTGVSKASEAAAKLLGITGRVVPGSTTLGAIHIMTDDEIDEENRYLKMQNASQTEKATYDGMLDAGIDQKLAAAEAEQQVKTRNLLLAATNMNRTDRSKLSDAIKNPVKALVAITNGTANKQQVIMLRTLQPDVYGKIQSYAQIALDSMKPSEKGTKAGNYLKSLALGLDTKAAMKSVMSMPSMPKAKASPKAGKIGTRSFGKQSTGYQDLQMRLGTGKG